MEAHRLLLLTLLTLACRERPIDDTPDPAPSPPSAPTSAAETSSPSSPVGTDGPRTESDPGPSDGRWYDFSFKGQKVGYLHAKEDPVRIDGQPALHVTRASVIEVRRRESRIRMESDIQSWVRPDGTPLRFIHRRVEGGLVRELTGRAEGDEFVIDIKVGDDVTTTRIPLQPDTILASTTEAVFFRRLKPGFTKTGIAISESEGDAAPYRAEVVKALPDGGFLVEEESAGILSRSRVDARGHIIDTELPAMGARFVRTDRQSALRLGAEVDIFAAGLFSVPQPLPPNQEIAELVVDLRTRSGQRPRAPADGRQTPEVRGDTVRLTVSSGSLPDRSAALPVRDPSVATYLEPTPFEKLDDPELQAAARSAAGDAKDVITAASRINRLVNRRLESKNLSQAFTSASEAWTRREGDCTEHSVLFSALAKIMGIPTRLVTGLVYVGGVRNQFGYHEWVEVWTGSDWHPMDPTFGQVSADPTHIKFAVGRSDPASLREAGVVAASLIGDLELDVRSYRTHGGSEVVLP
jgi:hypothetical protein